MSDIKLTKEETRQFLAAHHSLESGYELKGKQGILDFVERVGCIQFDTLNVVGRNPDLVLQSRVKNYKPDMLQELLYRDRLLLDQWDKEMSIYPVKDWPCFQRNRRAAYGRYKDIQTIQDYLTYARKTLEESGPATSSYLQL